MLVRELTEEADLGTLPLEHVAILASYFKRGKRGWLPAHIPQGAYVQAATTLAMRRCQASLCRGAQKKSYEREVLDLRAYLIEISQEHGVQPSLSQGEAI